MSIHNKVAYWSPEIELSKIEEFICSRLKRTGKLFVFLREIRDKLFTQSFQDELNNMYSTSPRGVPAIPPALLAMVTLLQAYEQKSDASAVEDSIFDKRWQMVLGCLGAKTPIFSQGVLVDFRSRLIAYGLDKRLLERTVELARETGGFGHNNLRIALDSAPLFDTRKWLAAKLCPRLYGDKDDAFVNLKFPGDIKNADSLLPMSTEIFRAPGNQEITPGQAKTLLGTLKDYSSAIAIIDLNQKMSALLENETPNHATIEGE